MYPRTDGESPLRPPGSREGQPRAQRQDEAAPGRGAEAASSETHRRADPQPRRAVASAYPSPDCDRRPSARHQDGLEDDGGVALGEAEYPAHPTSRVRTARPGETIPSENDRITFRQALRTSVPQEALDAAQRAGWPIVFWCRFGNVFGERFETRASTDPSIPPELSRWVEPGEE